MMNFKHICTLSITAILLIMTTFSCGKDDTYYESMGSHDAQLYGFSLKVSIMASSLPADSARWDVVNNTKFMIDQKARKIYNPDSLPYGIKLEKVMPKFTYSPTGGIPYMISFIYSDTTAHLKLTDSIDFTEIPHTISVISPNKLNIIDYSLDVRVHQIDLENIFWYNHSDYPSTVKNQKTIVYNNVLYSYVTDNTNISLYKLDPTASTWTFSPVDAGLDANIILSSILEWKGVFYAIDKSGAVYISDASDGTSWDKVPNTTYVHNILGVLPGATEDADVLLTTVKDDNDQYFLATTKDMLDFEVNTSYVVPSNAPYSDFTPITVYNRSNLLVNMLTVTGGITSSEKVSNLTWIYILDSEGKLRVASNQENNGTSRELDLTPFVYDNKFYAISGLTLYESSSWGTRWSAVSQNQAIDPAIRGGLNQSVVVDGDDNIWILGGINNDAFLPSIWQGRMAKYIK